MHFSHFQGINGAPRCAAAALPLSPQPASLLLDILIHCGFLVCFRSKKDCFLPAAPRKATEHYFSGLREIFLWPFQASLLWCLRTWLQAVKPPWPVCQGGNCYRRLSWVRTSTSGTASPTDCPAQNGGEIGHPATCPTRTAHVCIACVSQNRFWPLTHIRGRSKKPQELGSSPEIPCL